MRARRRRAPFVCDSKFIFGGRRIVVGECLEILGKYSYDPRRMEGGPSRAALHVSEWGGRGPVHTRARGVIVERFGRGRLERSA